MSYLYERYQITFETTEAAVDDWYSQHPRYRTKERLLRVLSLVRPPEAKKAEEIERLRAEIEWLVIARQDVALLKKLAKN